MRVSFIWCLGSLFLYSHHSAIILISCIIFLHFRKSAHFEYLLGQHFWDKICFILYSIDIFNRKSTVSTDEEHAQEVTKSTTDESHQVSISCTLQMFPNIFASSINCMQIKPPSYSLLPLRPCILSINFICIVFHILIIFQNLPIWLLLCLLVLSRERHV